MARIKKNVKPEQTISAASLSDMAFLLLIFFICTTVFVKERGIPVNLPRAETIDKIPRQQSVTVYVDRNGNISIDDFIVDIPMIEGIFHRKMHENFNTITAFRTDTDTPWGVMADVMNQMRRANALRVSFEARHTGR